jgi:hypothetical protein
MTSETLPPPPPPPPAPAGGPAPVARPTSTLAIVSLVAGVLGWILLPFVAGVAAVVSGHMARAEIRRSNGALDGDGLAVTGLVLGWVNVLLAVAVVLAVVLFFGGLAVLLGVMGLSGRL